MDNFMFETILHENEVLAYILRSEYHSNGIKFFTPNELTQQLGYMNHPAGHIIKPHIHNSYTRTIKQTLEVLIVKKGLIQVDFFDSKKKFLFERYIATGDIIMLVNCGHGFRIINDSEIIEIKQGPYAGEDDKIRFEYP